MLSTPTLLLAGSQADEHQAIGANGLTSLIGPAVQTGDDDGVACLPIPGHHLDEAAIIQLQDIDADAPAIGDEFTARIDWRGQNRRQIGSRNGDLVCLRNANQDEHRHNEETKDRNHATC